MTTIQEQITALAKAAYELQERATIVNRNGPENAMLDYWILQTRDALAPFMKASECDCDAPHDGKWAGIHSPGCQTNRAFSVHS